LGDVGDFFWSYDNVPCEPFKLLPKILSPSAAWREAEFANGGGRYHRNHAGAGRLELAGSLELP